jgi:hypothetical protein
MIAAAIFGATLYYRWRQHHTVKEHLRDTGIAILFTCLVFVMVFLFHVLILTPKTLIEESDAARKIAEAALEKATHAPVQVEVSEKDPESRRRIEELEGKLSEANKTIHALDPLHQPISAVSARSPSFD